MNENQEARAEESADSPQQPLRYEDRNYVDTGRPVWNYSILYDDDVETFRKGTHYTLYRKMGARAMTVLGTEGFYFCVWAPNATEVSVVGDFNNWNRNDHRLTPRWDQSGIWEGFIPGIRKGDPYKYSIKGYAGIITEKSDPLARYCQLRPGTASIAWEFDYQWKDDSWMRHRRRFNALNAPWSVYEVHLASWMRPDPQNEESYNSYEFLASRLVAYVKDMGFSHVELMPVMEYPFDGSWGYQLTGYFAATSRYGPPEGLMYLIDQFHQHHIGVILDWVPSHFPYDAHGLFMFDGTHTYEYADRRKGFHPDWNSYIFNYARGEVKSFLISSAKFWFDLFHIDGLRVDAVSSMLKLDYSRKEGEWEPNELGGNGNLEAIAFIRDLNETVYRDHPDVQTIAEEATDWPGVTAHTHGGGLGFGMKWMMGWMHDTLDYFKLDPIQRSLHQNKFTFSMMYYYDENFMLPLSHDEVVHGKSPMIYKMPGDEWQKFASLRTLYTYMWTHPGGRLLFMGNEFGQTSEWNYKTELSWHLLQHAPHRQLQGLVRALNQLLRRQPALYMRQFETGGFEWVDLSHREESVLVYRRRGWRKEDDLLVILNMTPVVRWNWTITLPEEAHYSQEVFNSDAAEFGGTGQVFNPQILEEEILKAVDQPGVLEENTAEEPGITPVPDSEEKERPERPGPEDGEQTKPRRYRITVNLPPLAGIVLK